MFAPQSTLAELVTERPEAARVLHRHGLDFCCRGRQSLEAALAGREISPQTLLEEVQAASRPSGKARNWREAPFGDLVQHILTRYHAPLREELPRLVELAEKVEERHADKVECPVGLAVLLMEVTVSVDSHLAKEEQILFPAILAGKGRHARMPIQIMVKEHEDHGGNLRRIREITRDLALPPEACDSWRALYQGLEELEVDLMDHIHLENNILFPRALNE
jgi:regulator of cell morphogenesis and NO signaling